MSQPLEGAPAGAGWTVCVDFGTAFSKAAAAPAQAWRDFKPELVRPLAIGAGDGGNPFLLPGAVFIDDDAVLLGAAANARAGALGDTRRQALRSFKTLLGAGDLERTLSMQAPLSIDPHRRFRQRDLIVLFLAALLRGVDLAIAADPVLAGQAGAIRHRYACPAWTGRQDAEFHRIVGRLFDEAKMVAAELGAALASPQGAPLEDVKKALSTAAAAGAPQPLMSGMIYEATAAAAYSAIGLQGGNHLIVVDMGAGTTDIAALVHRGGGFSDLPAGRVTLDRAGDFIDRLLLNLAIERSPALKTPAQKAELWKSLLGSIREIKEALFLDGQAVVRHQGRALVLHLRDLERDRDFKAFLKEVAALYGRSLEVLAQATGEKEPAVDAIAVGGGAAAPFIQGLLKTKPRSGKARIVARPATPDWAHAAAFGGNLAPIFPQLAIAIGGALAPDALLAAR